MNRNLFRLTVAVSLLCVSGCSVEDYNVVIKNVGTRRLEMAHVSYGDFRSIGGVLPPGIWKQHGNPEHPIPLAATVEWQTEDGQMHSRQVDVKRLVPKGFRGDIVFEIADDDSVTVRVVRRDPMRY